ncbi:ninja-family protein 1 isoform X2 [Setaria viridis]|uniref:ninja-family protein 1 isoform X2 n=1 Tax=Setaria viridis TaxID=4556 RepID=UPI0014935CFE|nr:ninja-family protein 1-like isoform X2 [Setaria viridis]
MEGYSRDLLGGIGRGDAPAPPQEQGPGPARSEEVELSLGLSLGGRFGVDRKGEKLARSSSMAAVMTAPVEAPALGRTSSLPVETEASEVGRKQGLDGWGSSRETGGPAEEPAARLRPSLSPSSGSSDGEGQRLQGTATAEAHSPSSVGPPAGEVASCATVASLPPSSLAGRAAALGSRGYQQSTSGTYAARARSMGDVERTMMQEMPSVFTKGLPNGNRLEGFLYKYRKGEQVRIVCICHGTFHTPAGFVEHAGGGNVSNPLRHIVVTPLENL